MDATLVAASRFLSLVLRHRPEAIGIALDRHGWTGVDELLRRCVAAGRPLDRAMLLRIVAENDKQRFVLSTDGTRIRANQGHSVAVDLQLDRAVPPDVLFHGTVERFVASILQQGLLPRGRHHVHLSADAATARTVGARRGAPIVLEVAAAAMHGAGHAFHRSGNGVWLCAAVPPQFLRRLEE